MNRLILHKLIISGGGHKDSIIRFTEGFNLIIGPSNTGKSLIMECIDYAFGYIPKKGYPSKIVDNNHGYTNIELVLQKNENRISLKRKIGTNQIHVKSNIPDIENDTYRASTNAKKSISDVLLKLININHTHKIITNQKGNTQRLSWRTILHLFFMKQQDIDRETSALLSPDPRSKTSSAAALLFLLTKTDANDLVLSEDPVISKAKREAIIAYIITLRDNIASKRADLEEKISSHNIVNVREIMESVKNSIDSLQEELNVTNEKSRNLMSNIYQLNNSLVECNTILHNFDSLYSQYISDVERLEFIIEGQICVGEHPTKKVCPFCKSEIPDSPKEEHIAASMAELSGLKEQIIELNKTTNDVHKKKDSIIKQINKLESEKNELDQYISNKITPKLSNLDSELENYSDILKWESELNAIKQQEIYYGRELFDRQNEEDPTETKYNIFSKFNYDLIYPYEQILSNSLKESNIGGADNTKLDLGSFDITINNISKSACLGGGYTAVINSLITISMQTYIFQREGYAPGFFIMDSPLTQLSEPKNVTRNESIKKNFMSYIMSQSENGQVIMIEQTDEIPFSPKDIANRGVNLIEFTQDTNEGRYGLLHDVVNPKHK
ncbi:AAA family ATPase [Hutsoniella sourekii]|uniref:AAA family ATPase n=1 Tax=Hutsoniella sourekii TaxID=87650 RepID=UPI0004835CEA|nr:AAA family ATPase [Hutsoniella sourekii]